MSWSFFELFLWWLDWFLVILVVGVIVFGKAGFFLSFFRRFRRSVFVDGSGEVVRRGD